MRVNPDRTFFALHPDQRPQIEIANLDVDKLKPAMDLCRVIKDGYEIERIRRANDISAMAHRAVLENLSGFRNESQIQGVFENVCIANLAGQAYDPIAGSGENISVMHYSDNDSPLIGRQLVCLDAGAEFENYASDVTRTFPISGAWPSAEAESIYNLVKEMQEYCIQRLKPGVKLLLLHQAAHWIATRGLLELGIFHNGTVEEIYNAQTSLGFYLHGLSHHMGLDVHDTINVSLWDRCADDETPIETPRRSNVPPPCHSLEHPPLEEGMVGDAAICLRMFHVASYALVLELHPESLSLLRPMFADRLANRSSPWSLVSTFHDTSCIEHIWALRSTRDTSIERSWRDTGPWEASGLRTIYLSQPLAMRT